MKIKVKKINDSQVEMNITNAWEDVEEDYSKELNKLLSNSKFSRKIVTLFYFTKYHHRAALTSSPGPSITL